MTKQPTLAHRGSSSRRPELDWSQVEETVTMLALAAVQIKTSVDDSDADIQNLTHSFTTMAAQTQNILDSVNELEPGNLLAAKQEIGEALNQIAVQINHSVVGFQFYDRISQRLDHISHSMLDLAAVIHNPKRLHNPESWHLLQNKIKGNYTMEAERIMFEHIMHGASMEEALKIYRHHFSAQQEADDSGDEIEFF